MEKAKSIFNQTYRACQKDIQRGRDTEGYASLVRKEYEKVYRRNCEQIQTLIDSERERMEYEYKNDYISYSRYEMLKKSLRKVQNTLNNHLELL